VTELLYALGIVTAVIVVGTTTACALILRSLVRANRVVAGRRSKAPLGWLLSWRQPARLHRRLRRAVLVAEAAVTALGDTTRGRRTDPTTALHEVATELTSRAALVDDWLVGASRLHPQWSRQRLAELSVEVRELEGSARRLQQLSGQWRFSLDRAVQATSVPPPALGERMDAVEAALQELPTGV